MDRLELLKRLLEAPEMSGVGTPEERAAFIALRIRLLTVREAAEAIGVSKSHVPNLASQLQDKLAKKMAEMRKKDPSAWSAECRTACQGLYDELSVLREESGSDWGDDWLGGHKIGNFDTGTTSQEDWAECRGTSVRYDDE
jgi:hypothetical protein